MTKSGILECENDASYVQMRINQGRYLKVKKTILGISPSFHETTLASKSNMVRGAINKSDYCLDTPGERAKGKNGRGMGK